MVTNCSGPNGNAPKFGHMIADWRGQTYRKLAAQSPISGHTVSSWRDKRAASWPHNHQHFATRSAAGGDKRTETWLHYHQQAGQTYQQMAETNVPTSGYMITNGREQTYQNFATWPPAGGDRRTKTWLVATKALFDAPCANATKVTRTIPLRLKLESPTTINDTDKTTPLKTSKTATDDRPNVNKLTPICNPY